jgi:hypothetical protein
MDTAERTGTYDPRHLVMELDGPDVVEVAVQGEEAATVLGAQVCGASEAAAQGSTALTPDFDLVIVAAGDQEGSAGMDGDASNRALGDISEGSTSRSGHTFVLLESVYEDAHAVVP